MHLWLVIDLEATTDEGGWPVNDMEIIEIGAVIVNNQGIEQDHLQRYIKPSRRPLLTPFCKDLTHIKQSDINSSQTLGSAWVEIERWLLEHQPRLAGWVSWGEYDRIQLMQQLDALHIDSLLHKLPHRNLKHEFMNSRQHNQPLGLKKALQISGLTFQGQQHRALNDARNTARLLPLCTAKS